MTLGSSLGSSTVSTEITGSPFETFRVVVDLLDSIRRSPAGPVFQALVFDSIVLTVERVLSKDKKLCSMSTQMYKWSPVNKC